MLVIAPDSMLGTSANVKIRSVGRWSVFGEVIEGSIVVKEAPKQNHTELQEEYKPNQVEEAICCATDSCGACACSSSAQRCGPQRSEDPSNAPQTCGDITHQVAIQSTLVRRNVEGTVKTRESITARPVGKDQQVNVVTRRALNIDMILWGGLAVSFALLVLITYKISSTSSH